MGYESDPSPSWPCSKNGFLRKTGKFPEASSLCDVRCVVARKVLAEEGREELVRAPSLHIPTAPAPVGRDQAQIPICKWRATVPSLGTVLVNELGRVLSVGHGQRLGPGVGQPTAATTRWPFRTERTSTCKSKKVLALDVPALLPFGESCPPRAFSMSDSVPMPAFSRRPRSCKKGKDMYYSKYGKSPLDNP